jgi:hypothetical protein
VAILTRLGRFFEFALMKIGEINVFIKISFRQTNFAKKKEMRRNMGRKNLLLMEQCEKSRIKIDLVRSLGKKIKSDFHTWVIQS